jgi:hypothetical protein
VTAEVVVLLMAGGLTLLTMRAIDAWWDRADARAGQPAEQVPEMAKPTIVSVTAARCPVHGDLEVPTPVVLVDAESRVAHVPCAACGDVYAVEVDAARMALLIHCGAVTTVRLAEFAGVRDVDDLLRRAGVQS